MSGVGRCPESLTLMLGSSSRYLFGYYGNERFLKRTRGPKKPHLVLLSVCRAMLLQINTYKFEFEYEANKETNNF